MRTCHLVRGLLVLMSNTLMNAICAVVLHQIVSGRHRQVICVLHRLIGAAVVSASRWKGLNLFMRSVVKGMQLFGVHYSKSDHVVSSSANNLLESVGDSAHGSDRHDV
ncbi:hypothetical protein C1H46_032329 [Malus baccata]|uniref:Uncharacterized protein n=1 Tax=Malus baccata TaxID=106549 RepID=A0A540L6I9_MALBA|nr:hypothetical protein C1H46_032329 [Malus baccata]